MLFMIGKRMIKVQVLNIGAMQLFHFSIFLRYLLYVTVCRCSSLTFDAKRLA